MGNLRLLQEGIEKLWTDELYSAEFRASPSRYRDFDHALKHILKSAVKLLEMTEEADHSGVVPGAFDGTQKFLADLVICTVRLALTHPDGAIDLESVVFDRIERKMGAKLDHEPDLIATLTKISEARQLGCSTGEAMSKIECWSREALAAAGKKKEPVMVKCPGSCGQMIRADWGHSCGSQEVHGMCPGCNKYIPPGFYKCDGSGSHFPVAQKR